MCRAMLYGIDALKECLRVEFGGNRSALARAINLKPQSVNEVIRSGKRVPAGWCIKLERATEGRFTRHQFDPDLYPLEVEQTASSKEDEAA